MVEYFGDVNKDSSLKAKGRSTKDKDQGQINISGILWRNNVML